MGVSSNYCAKPAEVGEPGDEGILNWILIARSLIHFANDKSFLVQVLMGIPAFGMMGVCNLSELLVGPSLVALFMLIAVGLILRKKRGASQKAKLA